MKLWTRCVAVTGLTAMATLPLAGQTTPPQTGAPGGMAQHGAMGKVAAADSKFMMEAAMGGMAEVEMGTLAGDKAASDEVKKFAQRMVTDHGKANGELKALAAQKNVTLPAKLSAEHQAAHARLEKLSGAAFDRAYMQDMVKDHDKDVAAFKHASTAAADADLKAWAGKTLPTLQEHQAMAKTIAGKVSASK